MSLPSAAHFFARRWRGEVPMRTLLGRDVLAVGTAVNLLATFGAVIAVAQQAPAWLAAAVHFGPLPYNLFLFAAVNRSPRRTTAAVAAAAVWLAVMTVV